MLRCDLTGTNWGGGHRKQPQWPKDVCGSLVHAAGVGGLMRSYFTEDKKKKCLLNQCCCSTSPGRRGDVTKLPSPRCLARPLYISARTTERLGQPQLACLLPSPRCGQGAKSKSGGGPAGLSFKQSVPILWWQTVTLFLERPSNRPNRWRR